METAPAPDLRYPIGRFRPPEQVTAEDRREWIAEIESAPARLRSAVEWLSDKQLDTPYRPGGWTVRQVVHHLPDSHMNSYVRFRLALTEDEPVIKPYLEDRWATLPDAATSPPGMSLDLLDALHRRWAALLNSLTPEQLQRTFRHPELGLRTLEWNLGLYAWHCRHHLAHIEALRGRMGWQRA